MIGALLFAYIAGVISTANPCAFALLPAYLAYRIRPDHRDQASGPADLLKAFAVGGAATGGFLIAFAIVGGALSMGGYWLMNAQPWAGFIIGLIMAVMGLAVLWGRHFRIPLLNMGGAENPDRVKGDLLFGVGYGVASVSCTLPIFLSVTGTAITGGLVASALSFTAYALGMGTVLMTLAVMAALARSGVARKIKSLSPYLNILSGIILLLAGSYVAYFFGASVFQADIPEGFDLIGSGQMLSGTLQSLMSGANGTIVFLSLLAILIILFLFAVQQRKKAKHFTSAAGEGGPATPRS